MAAFEERRKWTAACPKCGSQETTSSGVALPDPTWELMELLEKDDLLMFYEQVEDICLAGEDNIELIGIFRLKQNFSFKEVDFTCNIMRLNP